jgi:hypothetical protein
MPSRIEANVRKVTKSDLRVGLICSDRDGNRIRIDHIDNNPDQGAATLSYHFLNDELRVQEGIQDCPMVQFVSEGWYMAAAGKLL